MSSVGIKNSKFMLCKHSFYIRIIFTSSLWRINSRFRVRICSLGCGYIRISGYAHFRKGKLYDDTYKWLLQFTAKLFPLFNPLSANPTKWSNTLKKFVSNLLTNCWSVFDDFVKLALKELILEEFFHFTLFKSVY